MFSMQRSSKSVVWVYLHMPKTGGQTLRDHFCKCLSLHEEFIHLGPFGYEDAKRRGIVPFLQQTETARAKAKVILGHDAYYGIDALVPNKQARYITFLRDPASRLVSDYNFKANLYFDREGIDPPAFEEWLDSRLNGNADGMIIIDWYVRHCRGEILPFVDRSYRVKKSKWVRYLKAREVLRRMWFVGILERMDEDMPYLLSRMGMPSIESRSNVSGRDFPKRVTVDASIRSLVQSKCPWDYRLFRYACDLNAKVRANWKQMPVALRK